MTTVGPLRATAPRAGVSGRRPENLIVTATATRAMREAAVAAGDPLDAYLLTAALWQLVDDRLHPDPAQLRRAAGFLQARLPATAAALRAAAALVPPAVGHRLLDGASRALAVEAVRLADCVLTGRRLPEVTTIDDRVVRLTADETLRLPAGFAAFDQHPDDAFELARRYLSHAADPHAPVCVLGVRTSGSYLAPLVAAGLRALDGVDADVLSYRPLRPFDARERRRLRTHTAAGGRVLVIDDPPGAGTAFAAAAVAVERAGVPRRAITLLLPLFDARPPARLEPWDAVVLPPADWDVHRRLADAPATFARLVGPRWRVVGATRIAMDPGVARSHASARFRMVLQDGETGAESARDVIVEGAGLGLFGRTAVDIAGALGDHVPRVYGFEDGLLYHDGLTGDGDAVAPGGAVTPGNSATPGSAAALLDPVGPGDTATGGAVPSPQQVAAYVAARTARLSIAVDPTPNMLGRQPAWQVAAQALSRPFGPLAPAAELALGRLCRGLLRVTDPCLVDGNTELRHWGRDLAGAIRKGAFYEGTFTHLDALCFDPVFDLAGAAPVGDRAYQRALRAQYRARTGVTVDPERWMLYRMVHAWRAGQAGTADRAAVCRRRAMAIDDYLADRYLAGLAPADGGQLCAIDLDGVLETDRFGVPATTPSGAMALRALVAHGYRPVLASGRSVIDVRDRCDAFGLAGGVAEYGSAMYVRADGAVTDLRTPGDVSAIRRARAALRDRADADIDPAYRYLVRVRRGRGDPVGETWRGAAGLPWESLQVVDGEGQSDVVGAGVDKAEAVAALQRRLGSPGWALAVGDGVADRRMLAAAGLGLAPANAAPELRAAGIPCMRHGYQRGLLDACGQLLGHLPGTCPICAAPRFDRRARALMAVLAAPEATGIAGLAAAARIAAGLIGGPG